MSGKAHDVVKNYMSLNSESAYEEARKLLADRFRNPLWVAEAYKFFQATKLASNH